MSLTHTKSFPQKAVQEMSLLWCWAHVSHCKTARYVLIEARPALIRPMQVFSCFLSPLRVRGYYFCPQSRCNEEHLHRLNILPCLLGFWWMCQDKQTGERRVQRGPLVWIPGPREEGKVPGPVCADLDLHGTQIPKLRSFPSPNFFS